MSSSRARCSIVTVDQSTGVRGKEPLTALAGYRNAWGKVFLGQNLIHDGWGRLSLGDPAEVLVAAPSAPAG